MLIGNYCEKRLNLVQGKFNNFAGVGEVIHLNNYTV